MKRVAIMLVLVMAACGPGAPRGVAVDAGTELDAFVPLADAPPDGPPKKGFGDPCTDNNQCESDLCILVGTTGQCTQFCNDDCPATYGCLGVEGIVIEGEVSFVCVPTSNQLCTPCTLDSECTLIGMDKCLTYPDGDRACGRDCTDIGCPMGYACNTIQPGVQQCMAESNACDCTAANTGSMQACNITTPWNVCLGQQTCAGATGWGGCEPPSTTDDPDSSYIDSNCDGIDGDRAKAIFVSVAGANTGSCGLVYTDPCQTIAFAIARAQAAARPHIYVQNGTYNADITMANGISIFGGYDFNWKRDSYSMTGHTVTINGATATAVKFDSLTAATWLDDVIVRSANASTAGASSIGVLVRNSSNVELRGVSINPGAGGAGNPGTDGGPGIDGTDGGVGNPGCENSSGACSTCNRPLGGTPGGSSCSRPGGTGGLPGRGDDIAPTAGATGSIGTMGGPAATCNSSRGCDGGNGTPGGTGTTGPLGTGGASFGSFSGSTYVVSNGTSGSSGGAGQGGGGGGGGGGGTTVCDSYGSSGGGGGGGGCGGGLGTRGFGGGGSFGVVALDSLVVVTSSLVSGGTGGAGGRGGTGGAFGDGGFGKAGGPYGGSDEQDDGGDGGAGGNGGHGGRGGDGGGGGGGPSIGIVCLGSSANTVSIIGSTVAGGGGGSGGPSAAPGATGSSLATTGCN